MDHRFVHSKGTCLELSAPLSQARLPCIQVASGAFGHRSQSQASFVRVLTGQRLALLINSARELPGTWDTPQSIATFVGWGLAMFPQNAAACCYCRQCAICYVPPPDGGHQIV